MAFSLLLKPLILECADSRLMARLNTTPGGSCLASVVMVKQFWLFNKMFGCNFYGISHEDTRQRETYCKDLVNLWECETY